MAVLDITDLVHLPALVAVVDPQQGGARLQLAGELRMEPDPESRLGRHAPGRLTVFAAETGKRLGEVEVGRGPLTITSSPDGRIAYVACGASSTVPLVGVSPSSALSSVDLPDPFGPSTATNSPGATSRSTLSQTVRPPITAEVRRRCTASECESVADSRGSREIVVIYLPVAVCSASDNAESCAVCQS